jgi:Ring finger domain
MSHNYNVNNNQRSQQQFPSSSLTQPTIAAVPRTFEAQNRPPALVAPPLQQQSLAALPSINVGGRNRRRRGRNVNLRIFTDDDNNIIDNDDSEESYDDDDDVVTNLALATASGLPATAISAGGGTVFPLDEQQQMAVLANWRERERRQRTIRVFMMFLLMLLLMEEEPNSSSIRHPKNRHHNNLRRIAGLISSNPNRTLMSFDVYSSRVKQDEQIRSLGRTHPRYHGLVMKEQQRRMPSVNEAVLGNDYDYNEQVVQYVLSLADIEKDEFDSNAEIAASSSSSTVNMNNERTHLSDDVTGTTSLTRGRSSAISSRRVRTGLIMPYLSDPEEERKVYHYPWNSTGFYRGSWKRIANANHSQLYWAAQIKQRITISTDGEAHDSQQQQPTPETQPLIDGREEIDVTATNAAKALKNHHNKTAKHTLDDTRSHSSHRRLSAVNKLVSSVDIEHHMISVLQNERNDLFGVHLVPFGYHLLSRDDNNLTTSRHEEIRYASKNRKILPSPKVVDNTSTALPVAASLLLKEHHEGNLLPITLKLNSGRAAFQLFSRSIPAMKELSLVEGFIKLYDSPSQQGYSTKNDVLLRVRGVLIHSIGRLSLTANADISRTAFVMMVSDNAVPSSLLSSSSSSSSPQNDTPVTTSSRNNSNSTRGTRNTDNKHTLDQDDSLLEVVAEAKPSLNSNSANADIFNEEVDSRYTQTKQHRHRRLKSVVDNLANPQKKSVSSESIIEHIRDETIKLFGSNFENGEDKQQQTTWSLLASAPDDAEEAAEVHSNAIEHVHEYEESIGEEKGVLTSTDQSVLGMGTVKERRLLTRNRIPQKRLAITTTKDVDSIQNSSASSEEKKEAPTKAKVLPPWSDLVFPCPYVKDDEDETIRKTRTPASSQMTETRLELNAAHCLFEINMDVEPVQWAIGSWRKLVNYHVELAKILDPESYNSDDDINTATIKDSGEDTDARGDVGNRRIAKNGGKRRVFDNSRATYMNYGNDQALVVRMTGIINSPNCNFAAELNVTALRTDWDATTSKAVSYSFYMMLVCMIQILILLRQLLHSQSNAAAIRVSILCIGWQTAIDALLCLAHIYLSLSMQPLFTAFASVAFFKLLIFCVIEMKYMAIILQARNSNSGGQSIEVLRRQVAYLHLYFYVALLMICLTLVYVNDHFIYRLPFILALYSFWVPQIVLNVITEAKAPMHKYYIYGMSITRLVAPLYMLAFPGNFLRQVYPDHPADVFTCEMVVLWIVVQTAVLIGQSHYGARFMIPARFLPPKFDYSRPIPSSMLQPGADAAILLYEQTYSTATYDPKAPSSSTAGSAASTSATQSNTSTTIDSESQNLRTRHSTTATTTRMRGNRQNRSTMNAIIGVHPPSPTSNTSPVTNESTKPLSTATAPSILPPPPCCLLECSICYDDIDIRKRKDYMLAPCNHLFHRPCLSQWMDVKMECPICRTELPTS